MGLYWLLHGACTWLLHGLVVAWVDTWLAHGWSWLTQENVGVGVVKNEIPYISCACCIQFAAEHEIIQST